MGRVSREARLLFILIWTICDDAGRTRAASRMLASLLYPYDNDAASLIDGWLSELESERCIARYQQDGTTYLQVCKWLSHQKIDKPSKSRLPEFDESSRIVANPREDSTTDLGSSILDLGSRTVDLLRPPCAAEATPSDRHFDAFRGAFPKRSGSQPWGRAKKAISARLAEGSTWSEILDGVSRYSKFLQATGKVGTEFVMQASTFCGPDKHYLEPWTPPASKQQTKQDANVAASVAWLEARS